MSLGGRFVNIFVAPAEVFDEVKTSPSRVANWLVPLVAVTLLGMIYTMILFSQPAVVQQIREAQDKKFQQMVAAGKLTRQQADQQQAMIEKYMTPGFLKVVTGLGAIVTQIAMLFLVALIIWMLGTKAFNGAFDYAKSLEVVGLSTLITIPGLIISLLLAVIYGNQHMTPGPVLLVSHFDPSNKVHLLLSAFNVMSIWYIAVLAIGLARLSGVSFLKAALWGFGFWGVFTFGPILIFGGK